MNFRTTLIAALLLGLFGTYVYFFEFKKEEEKKAREEKSKKALSVDWDKLKGLKIINSHGIFVLKKNELKDGPSDSDAAAEKKQPWTVEEPRRAEADSTTINSLVNTLKSLETEQVVTENADNLQAFGLNTPALKIEISLTETEKPVPMLLIGDKSPIGNNSYAKRQGEEKVLLLSTNLESEFNNIDLFALREKKLFTLNRNDIVGIRIKKSGKDRLVLTRKGDQWKITHPFQARASETEANKLLNQLTGLSAQTFMTEKAENLARYGLAEPDWRIDLFLAPDRTQASLLLGIPPNEDVDNFNYLYAKRDEKHAVVVLKKELMKEIDKTPEDLREKKVFPFKSWKVKKVELSWKGQDVTIVRKEAGKWLLTAPIEVRASSSKVSSLLSELSQLEGDDFFKRPEDEKELARYGLVQPAVEMTLYQEPEDVVVIEGEAKQEKGGPTQIGHFLLGQSPQDKDLFYASIDGEDTIYQVKQDFYSNTIPDNIESFRTRKPLDVYPYLVSTIEYKGPKGSILLKKKNETWKQKKPESRTAADNDVIDLITALSELEVDHFIDNPPENLAEWGLAPAEQSISLKDEKGEKLGTVLFSGKGPEDEEGVFYVKAEEHAWIGSIKEAKRKKIIDKLVPFQK